MWKPKVIDKDIKEYGDNVIVWEPHPDLDKVPKKTVGEQIQMLIQNNEVLEKSRLQALNALGVDDDIDPDDVDDIDEYDDQHDVDMAIERLNRSVSAFKEKQKQQQTSAVQNPTESQPLKKEQNTSTTPPEN